MSFQVDNWVDRIGRWVLPPRCVLCGDRGQVPVFDLCAACESDLAVTTASPPGTLAAFDYLPPVDHLIHALKYDGALAHGRVLGTLLARAVLRAGEDMPDALLPVPLHPSRMAARGFNQSTEIARWAGRALGIEVWVHGLRRCRDTRPQVGLDPGQRGRNVEGAFRAERDVRGRTLAIVDDVVTTGATTAAVASALSNAGARSVRVWCIARARPPVHFEPP